MKQDKEAPPAWSVSTVASPSLADVTAQRILEAIVEGEITEDEPFPSQYQLGEWFGVSRTVIREATQILVSKGVLDVKHGKRMTILPPTHKSISETVALTFRRKGISVLDVLELRKLLEVEAAAFAAERATQEDIERMAETIRDMSDHLDDQIGYVDADVAFHEALFAASKQPAFEMVASALSEYLTESRKVSYNGVQQTKRALKSHEAILKAVAAKDNEAAKSSMRKHLEDTEEDIRRNMQRES